MNLLSSAPSLIVILVGPVAFEYMTTGAVAMRDSLPAFGRMDAAFSILKFSSSNLDVTLRI